MKSTHLYLIPGLAFDTKIFDHLALDRFHLYPLEWIEPLENESIAAYAQRLLPKEKLSSEAKSIILGHSFGGVIAQEIAHHLSIDMVILFGSIRDPSELPFHFRLLKTSGLAKLFSKKLSITTLPLWGGLHDFNGPNKKAFLVSMIKKHSDHYLKWALHNLLHWKKKPIPEPTKVIQIHGQQDKTFPLSKLKKPDFVIKNGSHIVLYTMPTETNNVLNKLLSEYS